MEIISLGVSNRSAYARNTRPCLNKAVSEQLILPLYALDVHVLGLQKGANDRRSWQCYLLRGSRNDLFRDQGLVLDVDALVRQVPEDQLFLIGLELFGQL